MQHEKVGLLGGSFDPIHVGHIHLAIEIKEHFHLDRVLFCPTSRSPFKTHEDVLDPLHRLNMTRLATEDIEGFDVVDYEVKKGGVCYTIDTVKHLKKLHPHFELFLILGEDLLESFHKWKEAEELAQLAPLLVGSREGAVSSSVSSQFLKIPNIEISSTYLRSRLSLNKYCGHLIPAKVLDYIHKHQLYLTYSK